MAQHRKLLGIIRNVLGAYTSRNSDYYGYWLFGFLVNGPGAYRIDLLVPTSPTMYGCPTDAAADIARGIFADQVLKAEFDFARITSEVLTITQDPAPALSVFGNTPRSGHHLHVAISAAAGTAVYSASVRIFAAPHDPSLEMRSATPWYA